MASAADAAQAASLANTRARALAATAALAAAASSSKAIIGVLDTGLGDGGASVVGAGGFDVFGD